MILSMAIFGTLAPFVRCISVSSGELALYRAVLAAVLIGAWLLLTRQMVPFGAIRRQLPLLLASGAAMGINWILLFEAYRYTTVSVATLSYYFAPVLVTAACPFLFRERLTLKQGVCFVMSTLGLVLITGASGMGESGTDHLGILFGLGAAVFYASVILLNKFIRGVEGIHRTFVQFLAAILTLIPYVALTGGVTLGGLDGIILAYVIGREYDGRIRLLVNDILTFIEPLRELFLPVNKTGAQGKMNVERMNEFYQSGLHLITFPSGKCSRKIHGCIIDPEWKKNFIVKAVELRRDVVPIHFEGRNSNFFYNLARLRTALGIKANLEMLYLADEFFRQRGAHFRLSIGQPIPWQTFDRSRTPSQWAEWVKGVCYGL